MAGQSRLFSIVSHRITANAGTRPTVYVSETATTTEGLPATYQSGGWKQVIVPNRTEWTADTLPWGTLNRGTP